MAIAQELTWEQIEQALPPEGMSARVDAHALAAGRVKEILANPEEIIKHKSRWPVRARKSKIMDTEKEARTICIELVKQKILRVAKAEKRTYDKEGNVIAADLFGVGNGKEFHKHLGHRHGNPEADLQHGWGQRGDGGLR